MASLLFWFIVYIRCCHLITKDNELFSATYILCSKDFGNLKIEIKAPHSIGQKNIEITF